jgi:hypothetical protein
MPLRMSNHPTQIFVIIEQFGNMKVTIQLSEGQYQIIFTAL